MVDLFEVRLSNVGLSSPPPFLASGLATTTFLAETLVVLDFRLCGAS